MRNIFTCANALQLQMETQLLDACPCANTCSSIQHAKEAANIVHTHYTNLRTEFDKFSLRAGSPFKDTAEEIHFFKEIKPWFLAKYIFYSNIIVILAKWPPGPQKAQQIFIGKELQKILTFYEDYQFIYMYHNKESNALDALYYCRSNFAFRLNMGFCITELDDNFSTGFDILLARMLAYQQLQKWLKSQQKNTTEEVLENNSSALKWTDSKSSLVELMYALYYSGAINNGNLQLKDLAAALEKFFQLNLNDYYNTFQYIRRRKKAYTPFIEQLKQGLERKISNRL